MANLKPPKNGVNIRMYRIGHGDCFLISFPRKQGTDPYHILIDCGYKPGSQKFLPNKELKNIINNLGEATNFKIDLVVITHEHQDHVNAFWKKTNPHFKDFEIKEAWFAWTEDPTDSFANKLRKKHKDELLGLIEGRNQLALALGEETPTLNRIDSLLNLELGGTREDHFNLSSMRAAAKDPSKSKNKQAMKFVKDKALKNKGVKFLNPGGLESLEETDGIKVYVLGPPRREKLLLDEDPVGKEGFPSHSAHKLSFNHAIRSDEETTSPFRREYRIEKENAFGHGFFKDYYGNHKAVGEDNDDYESPKNSSWRRIDEEWLYSSENLALKLNSGINNTSLVLAFELPKTKKVLLFAADAQRGNWISWDDNTWEVNGKEITAKDILRRTVLYKVGHHASHNATLKGEVDDKYPNLSWMGRNKYAQEFTAMITAVNSWAMTKNNPPWRHPLPSIKSALLKKSQGRVFQTDESTINKPDNVSDGVWKKFTDKIKVDDLYFDYIILDD